MQVFSFQWTHFVLLILVAVLSCWSLEQQGCLSWDAGVCTESLDDEIVQLQVASQVVKRRARGKPHRPAAQELQPESQDFDTRFFLVPLPDAADESETPGQAPDSVGTAPTATAHTKESYSLLQLESKNGATAVRHADAADGASMAFEAVAGVTLGLLGHGDGVTKLSFKHRWFGRLTAFLLVTFMLLLAVILIKVFMQHRLGKAVPTAVFKSGTSGTHRYVSAVTRTSALEVERLLPHAATDSVTSCARMRPMTSSQLVRLEARVEGPLRGNALTSPLVQMECVCFSAAVWKQAQDCTHPVLVAFQNVGVDFDVVLLDAPHVRVDVRGEDVSLFDMQLGPRMERHALATAPDHWKDFAVSYQTLAPEHTCTTSVPGALVGSDLEFQESLLVLGATVTLVGELCRSASGRLSLRPWNGDDDENPEAIGVHDSWRTSWELLGCPSKSTDAKGGAGGKGQLKLSSHSEAAGPHPTDEEPSTMLLSEADRGKVLISDDSSLFSGVARAAAAAAAAAAATAQQPSEPSIKTWLSRFLKR